MSDPTLSAVQGVAQDLRDLRADLTGRLDQMVTRREHEAEVKRLDQADTVQAERHDALVKSAGIEHAEIRALIEDDQKARKESAEEHRKERAADRRTYLTVTVAAVCAVASIVAAVVLKFAQ